MITRLTHCAAAASALVFCVAATQAQDYPTRPLRVVVPYAAGGSTDILARIVGQKLTEALGQQVVVDNRPGAGTLIATEIVARAAPDGHTLLMATPAFPVAPALYQKAAFDISRDFAAVTNIAATSNVLVVHPSVPAQTAKELIALAKAHPGFEANNWNGVVVPAGTTRAAIDRLQREIRTIVNTPAIRDKLLAAAFEPIADTPAEFARYLAAERVKWAKVVKDAGVKPE